MTATPTHTRRATTGRRLTPASGLRHPNRRTLTITAGIVVLTLTAVIIAILTTGPTKSPTPTPAPLTPQASDALEQLDTVTDTIAPTKGTHTTMLTPPGPDWWDLAISNASSLFLYPAGPNPIAAPTNANWYATTAGKSYATNSETLSNYQALHIGFPTEKQAHEYAATTYTTDTAQYRTVLLRGPIVTFAPSWLDPNGEPYRNDISHLKKITNLHPQMASWRINLNDHNDTLFGQSEYAYALHAAVEVTGFVQDSEWTGTSATPEGPWHGRLTDFDPDAIDIYAIGAILTEPNKSICNGTDCTLVEEPLRDLAAALYLQDARTGEGWGASTDYLPTMNGTGDGTLLLGGVNYGRVEGVINGSLRAPLPPVKVIQFAVYDDLSMTVWTRVRDTLPADD